MARKSVPRRNARAEASIPAARRKELQPAHALWKGYRPEEAPYRFNASTAAEARAWQKRTRSALAEYLGFQDLPAVDPAPRTLHRVDKGDYIREKVLIRTAEGISLPLYLLLPKDPPSLPLPTVLAFHGHGYGVKDIVGLWEDGSERGRPDGYHKDFGVALCRRGFAVAAPEISCFGERQNDFSYLRGEKIPTTCAHTSFLAMHLGGSALGLRVHDGRRVVDYLNGRKEFDTDRLGAMGISGGGMHTLYSTCLDERIRACVVSGYFCTFAESILAMDHCACNFVPGMGDFGEMHDLAGLVAPRPMLVEAATRDPIFPLPAVKRSVKRARENFRVFGPEAGPLETDYFEGRHEVSGAKAYDFLARHLGAE
jgi:dienelactone hydrolase